MIVEFYIRETGEHFCTVEFTKEQWDRFKQLKKLMRIHRWEKFFRVLLDEALAALDLPE